MRYPPLRTAVGLNGGHLGCVQSWPVWVVSDRLPALAQAGSFLTRVGVGGWAKLPLAEQCYP